MTLPSTAPKPGRDSQKPLGVGKKVRVNIKKVEEGSGCVDQRNMMERKELEFVKCV